MWPSEVAHALVRAVSRLVSTLWWGMDSLSAPGVGMSADAARMSACATSSPRNVCEKSGLGSLGRFLLLVGPGLRHPHRDLAHALDDANALRHADGAARIQRIKQVGALEHMVVGGQQRESPL